MVYFVRALALGVTGEDGILSETLLSVRVWKSIVWYCYHE